MSHTLAINNFKMYLLLRVCFIVDYCELVTLICILDSEECIGFKSSNMMCFFFF